MGMHTRYECLCVSLSVAGGLGVCGNSKAGERFCRCHACMCGVFCFVNIGEIVNSIIVIMTHDTDGAAPPAPPPPPAGAAGAFAAAAAGYAADAVVTAACAATDFFRSFLCGIFLPMLAIFVCVSMWLLRFVLCANCFVQSLNGQTNGLSPVCVRTCVRRLKSSENRLPQPS